MNVLEQFKLLSGMSTTRRFSQTRLHHEESILEHSAFVAIVAHQLGIEYNNLMENQPTDLRPLDLGVLVQKAIYHDVEEYLTGDVPRPTKYFSPESLKAFEKVAEVGMTTVLSKIELSKKSSEKVWELWSQSKDDLEGVLISIADLSAVVYKLWAEVTMMGNKTLLLVCNEMQEYIQSGKDKVARNFDSSTPGYWYLSNYLDELSKLASEAGVDK